MPEDKAFIVSVSASANLKEVESALRSRGLQVSEVFQTLGMVSGKASKSLLPDLEAIEGVIDIEEDQDYSASDTLG